jgi:hypothetical protein
MKVGYAELGRQRLWKKHARWLHENEPETVTMFEVAFLELARHMQTWPDEWHVDKHGDPSGNNPHVWIPYMSPLQPLEGSTSGVVGDYRCPCGLLKSSVDTKLYLDGLMKRTVT